MRKMMEVETAMTAATEASVTGKFQHRVPRTSNNRTLEEADPIVTLSEPPLGIVLTRDICEETRPRRSGVVSPKRADIADCFIAELRSQWEART